jgi:hypothetical protein
MKIVLAGLALALGFPTIAAAHLYLASSPTHEQTFAYGSERHQAWIVSGPGHHLALAAEFTNDPYVDRVNPRQYDDFTFDFPAIRLGVDGKTFFYHSPRGQPVPVAERHKGLFGLDEVRLLPNAELLIQKPHGYLSVELLLRDRPSVPVAAL